MDRYMGADEYMGYVVVAVCVVLLIGFAIAMWRISK